MAVFAAAIMMAFIRDDKNRNLPPKVVGGMSGKCIPCGTDAVYCDAAVRILVSAVVKPEAFLRKKEISVSPK